MTSHPVSTRPHSATSQGTGPRALTPVPEGPPEGVPAPSPTQLGLCRRLRMALYDLGILSVTGEGWATPAGEGIGFANLPLRAADDLVRRMEDLASPTDQPWTRPGTPSANDEHRRLSEGR